MLSIMAVIMTASCKSRRHPIVGDYDFMALKPNNIRLHIYNNGKFLVTDKFFERKYPYKYKGTWELTNDTLILDFHKRSFLWFEPTVEKFVIKKADSTSFWYVNTDSIQAYFVRDSLEN